MSMRNEKDRLYTTLDAYQAGFLSLNGFIPKLIEQGDKVVFCFQAGSELFKAISEYNGGALVEASRLAFAIKTLKSQIHSLRREKGNYIGREERR